MQESASHSNVSLLKTRSKVYKLGLKLLLYSFLGFIIALSSPSWIGFEHTNNYENNLTFWSSADYLDKDQHQYAGLWDAPCFYYDASCYTGILVARIALCFHLAGYVLCLVVAVYENWKKVNPISYHSRVLELCVFVTGIIGTAGLTVFAVWYSGSFFYGKLGWAFIGASTTVIGVYCSLLLILCGNRRQFITVQGTVLQQPQPGRGSVLSSYEPSHSGGQTQQASQNQPLLPAQPDFCPPANHPAHAPPPYSFAPAYPSTPSPPDFSPLSYHEYQVAGHVQTSAPRFYDDKQP